MKYGVIRVDYYKQNLSDAVYISNLGDTCTTKSIDYLFDHMGISHEDRVYIGIDDIWTYEGEFLICPINTIFFQKKDGHDFHKISKRIIPVFLSISYSDTSLSKEDIEYLKRYEPIGCRDEQTLKTMQQYGVMAYLNGCMVATFPKREKLDSQNKVFFVDVPYMAKKYLPEEIKKDIVFIKQEILSDQLPEGKTQLEWANDLLERYKNEAKLIVTSRFHAAVLGLAMGIPTIIVNESYTYRFSWLRKLLPFYTRDNISDIDWYPNAVDFEKTKYRMIRIATKRIAETVDKWRDLLEQTEYLEDNIGQEAGLIDYYDEAVEFINRKWDKNDAFLYSFWGVNNNANAIQQYIKMNYPNAKLVEIYDTFKEIEFEGIKSIKPECISPDKHLFIFVTTFVAGYVAEELFERIGVLKDEYFICTRRYIEDKDL